LNFLANRFSIDDLIPPSEADPKLKYGYQHEVLEWRAAFSPLGFQLHLVGVQVLLLREAGVTTPELDRAAAILAARQDQNAFFAYLHLDSDKYVSDLVRKYCKIDERKNLSQWIWERDQRKTSDWQHSMMWDCIFLVNLLNGNG
jgi:hypothetical protein